MMNTFEQNILNIYGQKGREWLEKIPATVQQISETWNLTNLNPIETMTYNYVLFGTQRGKPIILKLSLDAERLNKEIDALKIFSGYGVPKVLNNNNSALLLEHLIPGYTLKTFLSERKNEARIIACQVMKKLHQASFSPAYKNSFPLINDLLKILDKTWDIPSEYLIKARFLRDNLLETHQEYKLLHWDLHHENILLNDNEWFAIDPQGVIGPSISETWAFIVDPILDTEYIARYFNYPLENIRQWYFVRLILAICWNLEDNLNPQHFLHLAELTFPFV